LSQSTITQSHPQATTDSESYIPVRKSQIGYYRDVALFYRTPAGNYALYKPAGTLISDLRIGEMRHPALFIRQEDRIAAIRELQQAFNRHIAENIAAGNVSTVKSTLCLLVEETLAEPRSGALQVLPETVDLLVSGYSKQPQLLKTFAHLTFKDYSTVIHSVNVMALTLGFCFHTKRTMRETSGLGLSALLHDVGKTQIPPHILTAPRKLTDTEFKIMQSHPTLGSEIIRGMEGGESTTALGALQHHEKLDGSGYPAGIQDISFDGRLLGLIDCYEALTNEDRPYRRAQKPFDTLSLIKQDVNAGKFSRTIFEQFCYSLL
jgi:HD-GYP domain-containing protein (c-di-GMP phosphodiesterase class II)